MPATTTYDQSVLDQAVLVPDMYGEVDFSIVPERLDHDADIDDAQLRSWVGDALATFKVPSIIERWPGKLPRNASGKLLKNVLRGSGPVSFAETM